MAASTLWRRGFIYFIAEMEESERYKDEPKYGLVKVGWAINPKARRTELQCGNPRQLVLLGWASAMSWDERTAHTRLAQYRVRGEWFDLPHSEAVTGPWLRGAPLEELLQVAVHGERHLAAA